MGKAKVCIITGYGINADKELAKAFSMCGAEAELQHINDLIESPDVLNNYNILGFPGGFSFGDHLGSGLVFSHKVKKNLTDVLQNFIKQGKLIIGICNGFQVLVKMGILPDISNTGKQEVSLIHNDSGAFVDNWVHLDVDKNNSCKWLTGTSEIEAPVRHGEGKFVASDEILEKLENENLIALTYRENPNGSMKDIAGISDTTGQVLGMMPHLEAFLIPENHPQWNRGQFPADLGLAVFRNGIKYVENL